VSHFDSVTEKLGRVRYMNERAARVVRSLIEEIDADNILELGSFQGKSACYMAAILEDRGSEQGHVTTIDVERARHYRPSIIDNVAALGLSHRVTPILAHRSFTWELARLLKKCAEPQFDFCYLDGGHTWDVTGFAFVIVDMLLKPGGIIVLDDLDWTIRGYTQKHPDSAKSLTRKYDADEMDEPGVRLVWNSIVQHMGYDREEISGLHWGVARKPPRAK
jgi:predicted O-methyltransferase YrrM